MIDLIKYSERIANIISPFLVIIERMQIVPSITDWCNKNEIDETSPFSPGRCLRNKETGKYLILLSECVSDDEKQSIIDAIAFRGCNSNDTALLVDEWLFVMHLVLHECTHAFNPAFSEFECDNWAFENMKQEISPPLAGST